MGKKAELAQSLFEEGYNCAQAVVCAFSEELGMEKEQVARLICGLGGGVGRLREICGAVSGMAVVSGSLYGYSKPEDLDGKKRTYEMIQKLSARFREENGSILCRELLKEEGNDTSAVPAARTEQYYQDRPCPRLVYCAARILEEYQNERSQEKTNG